MGELTFDCTFDEFKRHTKEFIEIAESEISIESLEAGLKCLALHYLAIRSNKAHEMVGAEIALKIAMRYFTKAEKRILGF